MSAAPGRTPGGRVLVAGLGNIFLGDDGFGVEAVARLARRDLPPGVETADIGVRGVHLAYQLLDGYDTVVLLDATARGGAPGTVYLIDEAAAVPGDGAQALIDGHRMTPDAVLALLDTLSAGTGGERPRRIAVVGCEPACLDEGIGLSDPVAASVDEAVDAVLRLLSGGADHRQDPAPVRVPAPEGQQYRDKETRP
ncbi:hydrogenase maturation protease [Streptomyces sp. V4-01]|uniref:Hydrogenase maturation protease n=1 Tax=Actinacidiphila polyblastidii TaxID=3110430 RepID=A0ABU7PDN0_9ACTN|nr:hydrogenase maturation protease [Streptomyces sp. V4-01]